MGAYDVIKQLHIGFPRDYIALSRGFTSSHRGIDMCWSSRYGGANAPVYAPGDGEVVALDDGWGNTWSYDKSNWGNYIKIKHADGIYTLMAHLLKGSLLVKVGDKVTRGQMIAKMNNSGASNGSHVHFELYLGGKGTSYRVDPLKYCYAYAGEDVVDPDERYFDGTAYHIMVYEPVKTVGTPVPRNRMVDQLEVITDTLNARKEPGLKGQLLGYVKQGIYNVKEVVVLDGYTWYSIEDFWCANDAAETWCHYLPTEYVGHPVERNEYVNQINVTATSLRARKDPGTDAEILGLVNPGIYNCLERAEANGYKWYKAEDEWNDFWCAQQPDGDWVEYLPAKDPHYNLTMFRLNPAQASSMEAWCKAEGVEYNIAEA